MGEAIIKRILAKGLTMPQDIIASDISPERLSILKQSYSIETSRNNRQAIEASGVAVLAVKPQNLGAIMEELRGGFQPHQLVLSIIAGATIATITNGLGHSAVVRAMPNTPAQIGEGMTVWTASSEVSQSQKETAQSILGALGKEVYVPDEKFIDMATAVSGSGPAYFFLIMEALIDAAADIGLPQEVAEELVLNTAVGAARLAQETGKYPKELREMVTSPGGTTEKGVLRLEQGDIRALIAQAVIAAYERAKELGS